MDIQAGNPVIVASVEGGGLGAIGLGVGESAQEQAVLRRVTDGEEEVIGGAAQAVLPFQDWRWSLARTG